MNSSTGPEPGEPGGPLHEEPAARRPLWVDLTLLAFALIILMTLIALGNWQIQRLGWKLDLIEAVETRAFQEPTLPPTGPVTADDHAYLRVVVEGRYRHRLSRRVKALTELGGGAWLLTPLQTATGHVWINRGFIPMGVAESDLTRPDGPLRVEGLLRITEPDGTLLEKNDPKAGRWFSRDVEALTADVGLRDTERFFIDADHQGAVDAWPRGGLTQIAFRNSHLAYALTWYAMALLWAGAIAFVIYDRRRNAEPDRA